MDESLKARAPDPPTSGLRFGVFEMDLASGELRRGGVLVRLPPQPFQLLALLAQREGEVLSREQIRVALWGDGTVVDFDQRLNSCVNQIRQVLSDDADSPRYVETLPRRGYRWLAPTQVLTPTTGARVLQLVPRGEAAGEPADAPSGARPNASRPWSWLVAAAALAVAGGLWLTRPAPTEAARWQRLTFQRGLVHAASFGSGGDLYWAASWEGAPSRLYAGNATLPDARAVEIPPFAVFVGASSRGELAFISAAGKTVERRLWRQPAVGGAPREVATGVWEATWLPDGSDFAALRFVDGKNVLESPLGHPVAEVSQASDLAVSPDGRLAAFLEHPVVGDDGGHVAVVDLRSGARRRLTEYWASTMGLAWAPDGREIYFTATRAGTNLGLHAVSPDGERLRTLATTGSRLILHEVAADGRMLLDVGTNTFGVRFGREGQPEGELGWFDSTSVVALSADGEQALLLESGEAGGPDYGIYLRPTSGGPAVRLGSGRAHALSPDARWVLAIPVRQRDHIDLIPTGAGNRRELRYPGLVEYDFATFVGDGERILFTAMPQGKDRFEGFLVEREGGGAPRPLGPLRIQRNLLTPDARSLLRPCEAKGWCLQPLDGGEALPIESLAGERPLFWGSDGRTLYVRTPGLWPALVSRLDLASGAKQAWRELAPEDRVGLMGVADVVGTPDGRAYAYWYNRRLSSLYLVDGLR
jgi:DNA-binding winged helix-turn-helix (wHTH) protein